MRMSGSIEKRSDTVIVSEDRISSLIYTSCYRAKIASPIFGLCSTSFNVYQLCHFPQHVIEQKQTTGVRDLETNHFVSLSKFILSFRDVIHNFELCNLPERLLFTVLDATCTLGSLVKVVLQTLLLLFLWIVVKRFEVVYRCKSLSDGCWTGAKDKVPGRPVLISIFRKVILSFISHHLSK